MILVCHKLHTLHKERAESVPCFEKKTSLLAQNTYDCLHTLLWVGHWILMR